MVPEPSASLLASLQQAGFEIGVGVDVEAVARWRELLGRREPWRLAALFTPREMAGLDRRPDLALHLAGRWCAKEAAMKALTRFDRVSLRDVEIVDGPGGAPHVRLESLGPGHGQVEVRVSISHTGELACAVAVALRRSS